MEIDAHTHTRSLCVCIHVLQVGLLSVSIIKVAKHFLLQATENRVLQLSKTGILRLGFSTTGLSKVCVCIYIYMYIYIYINFTKSVWLFCS